MSVRIHARNSCEKSAKTIAKYVHHPRLHVCVSVNFCWLHRYNLGDPDGEYKAPFAPVWRNIAVVAVNGSKDLPEHCMTLFGAVFGFAILLDLIREYLGHK